MGRRIEISRRRWLRLPVETKARELHAKVLQACVAAERGWGAVIGRKSLVRGDYLPLPHGTFIEKTVAPGSLPYIRAAQGFGARISAWCEEGLIYFSREDYVARRIEPASLRAIDHFFAWGARQSEDICAVLGERFNNIVVSGNPRIDLLRPEVRNIFASKANKISRRYGDVILINTRFRAINNGDDSATDYIAYLRRVGKIRTLEHEAFFKRLIRLQEKVLPFFTKLIPVLSKGFPDHTIVVRPHPSERNDLWLKAAEGLRNVKVVYEGNVNEWLMSCDVMIHSNCTTGVEAFMLGRPAISYRPAKDPEVESELSDEVSLKASSESEIVLLVQKILNGGPLLSREERDHQIAYAKQYIANIDGRLACDRVMDCLDGLNLSEEPAVLNSNPSLYRMSKQFVRSFLPRKPNYSQKKFPGIRKKEIEALVKDFSRVTGRFERVEVAKLCDDVFCVFQ